MLSPQIVLDPEAIGKIWKIRLEHDNRYEGCGWHVEQVRPPGGTGKNKRVHLFLWTSVFRVALLVELAESAKNAVNVINGLSYMAQSESAKQSG